MYKAQFNIPVYYHGLDIPHTQENNYPIDVKGVYDLAPVYGRNKSYYGKAKVLFTGKGIYLQSYATIVCYIDNNGKFHRTWRDYSATTQKHIHDFSMQYINRPCGKKDWDAMDVEDVK